MRTRVKFFSIITASALLVTAMSSFLPISVFAAAKKTTASPASKTTTTTTTTTNKSNSGVSQKTQNQINDLQNQKNSIKNSIDSTNSKLVSVLTKINMLDGDIKDAEADIEDLNSNIAAATQAADQQYQTIKLRIQYSYENSSDTSLLTLMVESKSIADFVNRVEYANTIYKYDKELLDSYYATTEELKTMEKAAEDEKKQLEVKKSELSAAQSSLNATLNSLKAQQGDIETQLQAAQKKAAEEAEAQRRAEAEAAARAAAEKALREAQERAARNNSANSNSASNSSASNSSSSESKNNSGNVPSIAGGNPSTSVNGQAIVSYANQFVGNPYVWGGNDLLNGIDCSGFVHKVYDHFGIETPRYSQSFLQWGNPVAYDSMKAGDVVVYPGHVAIYMGNGNIVEAANPTAGIINTRSVLCKKILGIRRAN